MKHYQYSYMFCLCHMQAGGPDYTVELGRRDGRTSTIASVQRRLPHPTFNLDQLNTMFSSNGLSQTDMIALSGRLPLSASYVFRLSHNVTYVRLSDNSRRLWNCNLQCDVITCQTVWQENISFVTHSYI